MSSAYDQLQERLRIEPHAWLVTGAAGFIGSNLVEKLLLLGQTVIGLDNFETGYRHNLEQAVADAARETGRPEKEIEKGFAFVEGDICDLPTCQRACQDVDFVLHQAALGSVPRSIDDPIHTNQANIDGFLNMLVASRDANVRRFVYAASSSTYGDHEELPKVEDQIGNPLSPYAVTKLVNELYASVFSRAYDFKSIGLRYFNIFGKRQDPNGAYAAVIPTWVAGILKGEDIFINGDGQTSRDFCFVANAVQANLLAALTEDSRAIGQVYNVAVGESTTLNELHAMIRESLQARAPDLSQKRPIYRDFRAGDVRHSLADISKAKELLGYEPTHRIGDGLQEAMDWYVREMAR